MNHISSKTLNLASSLGVPTQQARLDATLAKIQKSGLWIGRASVVLMLATIIVPILFSGAVWDDKNVVWSTAVVGSVATLSLSYLSSKMRFLTRVELQTQLNDEFRMYSIAGLYHRAHQASLAGAYNNPIELAGFATPLHIALREGDYALAHSLLQEGASLKAQDETGKTPLHWAMMKGYFALAEEMVNSSDVSLQDLEGNTPLHLGLNQRTPFELIVKMANAKRNKHGLNLLHTLMINCPMHQEAARIASHLLKITCRYDEQDNLGKTALHYAYQFGAHNDVIGLMFEAEDIRDHAGHLPTYSPQREPSNNLNIMKIRYPTNWDYVKERIQKNEQPYGVRPVAPDGVL